jgi:hypothetical protein
MRYFALLALTLALAACGSSHPPATAAAHSKAAAPLAPPTTTGPQCARQVRSWLGQQIDDSVSGGSVSVRYGIGALVRAAKDYRDSGSAGDQNDLALWVQDLGSFAVPACADPGGYGEAFITDAQAAASETDPGQGASDVQNLLSDFGSLNTELRQSAPGTQFNQSEL